MKVIFNDNVLWDKVKVAGTFGSRFKGLMGKKNLDEGEGLIISQCNQVHSFNMNFPIDVIFLTKQMEILKITTMDPGKVGAVQKHSACVLEVEAGSAEHFGVANGDTLKIDFEV